MLGIIILNQIGLIILGPTAQGFALVQQLNSFLTSWLRSSMSYFKPSFHRMVPFMPSDWTILTALLLGWLQRLMTKYVILHLVVVSQIL